MKKIKVILLIILLVFSCQGFIYSSNLLDDSLADFWDEISTGLSSYEGYISARVDEVVYINLGRGKHIYKGDIFDVYRKKSLFTDPITGVILGRIKVKVGEVKITRVEELYSVATINNNGEKVIEVRDTVRLKDNSRRIAIVGFSDDGVGQRLFERVIDSLEDKIEAVRIYSLIPNFEIEGAKDDLGFEGELNRYQLQLIKDKLDLDFLFIVDFSQGANNLFLHGQLLAGDRLELIGENLIRVSKDDQLVSFYNKKDEGKSEYSLFYKSDEFEYGGRDLVLADLNNDGNKEVVLNSQESLKILSYYDDSIVELESIEEYSLTPYDDYKLIAINPNNIGGDKLIFEYLNNLYRLTWDGESYSINILDGLFRNRAKDTLSVEGKNYLITRNHKGLLRFNLWEEDIYKERFNIKVSDNVGFRVKVGDIKGKGEQNIVASLYDNNEGYRIKIYDLEGEFTEVLPGSYAPIIVLGDIGYRGKEDIFLVRNEGAESRVLSWSWDGEDYIKSWVSEPLEGSIEGMDIGDITGDFEEELILLFQKEEKSSLYIYKLKN